MSVQDDPEMDKQKSGDSDAPPMRQREAKRLESLLLDEQGDRRSVERLAAREVKVVGSKRNMLSLQILGLLLFGLIVFVTGYYYLGVLPTAEQSSWEQKEIVSQMFPVPDRPDPVSPVKSVSEGSKIVTLNSDQERTAQEPPSTATSVPELHSVVVGPFISHAELEKVSSFLRTRGFQSRQIPGRGKVTMFRLLEGVYPGDEARKRLVEMNKIVDSAFLLPVEDKRALYVGSFHDETRAQQLTGILNRSKIRVSQIKSDIVMDGTMLVVQQLDSRTAGQLKESLAKLGLNAQLSEDK